MEEITSFIAIQLQAVMMSCDGRGNEVDAEEENAGRVMAGFRRRG